MREPGDQMPLVSIPLVVPQDVVDLLLKASQDLDPERCWDGLGSPHGNGYMTIYIRNRRRYLHRVSYTVFKGPIPPDATVDHTCRNRYCWNPNCLDLKTNEANILAGESPPAKNARKKNCPTCGGPYKTKKSGGRFCPVCRQANRTDTKRKGRRSSNFCVHGHEFTPENTYLVKNPDGSIKQRMCRECGRQRVRARRAKEKGGGAL